MPMHYTIDEEAQVVRINGTGLLTNAEMLACVRSLRDDPNLTSDMPTLSDMRHIEVGFTADGIQQMLSIMHAAPVGRENAKAAIVVSSDVAFGMGRMLGAYTNEELDPAFKIFRDMSAAEDWLGLHPPRTD